MVSVAKILDKITPGLAGCLDQPGAELVKVFIDLV